MRAGGYTAENMLTSFLNCKSGVSLAWALGAVSPAPVQAWKAAYTRDS